MAHSKLQQENTSRVLYPCTPFGNYAQVAFFQTDSEEAGIPNTSCMIYMPPANFHNPNSFNSSCTPIDSSRKSRRRLYCSSRNAITFRSRIPYHPQAVPSRKIWRRLLMPRQPYSVAVLSTGGRLHPLFYRHTLRQISRHIHIQSLIHCHIVSKQLQRNHAQ